MNEILAVKLHEYLKANNPDMLLALQQKNTVTAFINNKISSIADLL